MRDNLFFSLNFVLKSFGDFASMDKKLTKQCGELQGLNDDNNGVGSSMKIIPEQYVSMMMSCACFSIFPNCEML